MKKNLIGSRIIKIAEVDSTNRYLVDLLNDRPLEEGTVVVAQNQFAGKGQGDHKWESEPGKNLTFSFVVYPGFLDISRQFMLNKIISLAIKDFIVEELTAEKVSIKWMNDVYVDDNKIAGMLINNAIQGYNFKYSVIGIGININQEIFRSDAPNPVSLKALTNKEYNLEKSLKKLFYHLNNRYLQLRESQFKTIDSHYVSSLYKYNSFHPYIYQNEKIIAKITGVDAFGRLKMLTEKNQELSCEQGDVSFVISV
jgi:BirA family biotin operon repressor/biotin-[acetyl-CoA-carboxylase] ligase